MHILIVNLNKELWGDSDWKLDYSETCRHYEAAANLFPNYALPHYLNAHMENGLPDYGGGNIEEAIKLNTEYEEAFLIIAWLDYQNDDYESAAKNYSKYIENALQRDERLYQALFYRAYSYSEINKLFESILDYNLALELFPDKVEVFAKRAYVKRKYRDYKGAIEDYKSAIEYGKEFIHFYFVNCGDISMIINDYNGAIEYYTAAINLDSKPSHIYTKRSEAYKMINELELSKNDSSKASEILFNNIIKSDENT